MTQMIILMRSLFNMMLIILSSRIKCVENEHLKTPEKKLVFEKAGENKEKDKGDAMPFASGTTIGHLGLHLIILIVKITILILIVNIIIIILKILLLLIIMMMTWAWENSRASGPLPPSLRPFVSSSSDESV